MQVLSLHIVFAPTWFSNWYFAINVPYDDCGIGGSPCIPFSINSLARYGMMDVGLVCIIMRRNIGGKRLIG